MKLSLLSIPCASSSNNPTEKRTESQHVEPTNMTRCSTRFMTEENHQDHNKITILDLFDWQKLKCDITKS